MSIMVFIGIDPTAGRRPMNYAVLDGMLRALVRAAGFERYAPDSAAPRQVLEVHPHACFTVLLGHLPTPKNTLEGRLQRQLVLYRAGVGVPDPMQALEELTAHHLLAGTMELPG